MAKILLVDDDNMLRELMCRALTRAGHHVVDLSDGREVERCLQREPFDLVITDILMPNRDGIETLTMLRESHPDIKVIAISGGGDQVTLSYLPAMSKLGADATLAKPFRLRELTDMVAELVSAEGD